MFNTLRDESIDLIVVSIVRCMWLNIVLNECSERIAKTSHPTRYCKKVLLSSPIICSSASDAFER